MLLNLRIRSHKTIDIIFIASLLINVFAINGTAIDAARSENIDMSSAALGAKDGVASGQVNALASSIGATIGAGSSVAGSDSSVDTLSLALGGDGSSSTQQRSNPGDPNANPPFPFVPSDDPITPDATTGAEVQIFIIFTGPSGVDTSALEDIAETTGGAFLTATDEDLVNILLKIINLPPGSVILLPQR